MQSNTRMTQLSYMEEKELNTSDSQISLGVENLGKHCIIWSMCEGQQAEIYSKDTQIRMTAGIGGQIKPYNDSPQSSHHMCHINPYWRCRNWQTTLIHMYVKILY